MNLDMHMRTCSVKSSDKCLGTVHDPEGVLILGLNRTRCIECKKYYHRMHYVSHKNNNTKFRLDNDEIREKKKQIAELKKQIKEEAASYKKEIVTKAITLQIEKLKAMIE